MKIIKPVFEIWDQKECLEGIYEHIERCGRVCYASDPIEGKAKTFVDRLIKLNHGAMLEHGTVYITIPIYDYKDVKKDIFGKHLSKNCSKSMYDLEKNIYTRIHNVLPEDNKVIPFTKEEIKKNSARHLEYAFITTNFRVLVENNCLDILKFISEPTEHHEKRVTVQFTTQIAISREFNRHRVNSIAEQSTRYCNYSKGKFGEIGINLPSWIDEESLYYERINSYDRLVSKWDLQTSIAIPNDSYGTLYEKETYAWEAVDWWLWSNACSELAYKNLIRLGWSPQQARTVLPLDTNTQLIHTAFVSDWKHFFDLRAVGTTGAPHPDAEILAKPLIEEFKKRGLLGLDPLEKY